MNNNAMPARSTEETSNVVRARVMWLSQLTVVRSSNWTHVAFDLLAQNNRWLGFFLGVTRNS